MKSNFGIHLQAAIENEHMSQLQFEKNSGIRQSTTNSIINLGRRPHPDTLAAITSYAWQQDKFCGVALLIEHLRDEINRSKLLKCHPKTKISIEAKESDNSDLEMLADAIKAHARYNPDVKTFVLQFLSLLGDPTPEALIAAEDRPKYGKDNK